MKFIIYFICFIFLLLPGCNRKKHENAQAENKKEIKANNHPSYSPPSDSTISYKQMEIWLSCNPRLDSLSYHYLDSFKVTNPENRLRYQKEFIEAQNTICTQQGLSGGYKEYLWILQNTANKKNKQVLKAFNLKEF